MNLGPSRITDIAAGTDHTCAVFAGGTVGCWGRNQFKQLGAVPVSAVSSGVIPPSPMAPHTRRAVRVVSSGNATCALTTIGTVWCWGRDASTGAVGNGVPAAGLHYATQVASVAGAVAIDARSSRTCVVLADHTLTCWGLNNLGKAIGAPGPSAPAPKLVSSAGNDVVGVLGSAAATCVIKSAGTVWCWGAGAQRGIGPSPPTSFTPTTQISAVTEAAYLTGTENHACGGDSGGQRVRCWGRASFDQLGFGTFGAVAGPNSFEPTKYPNPSREISVGNDHSCAITIQGLQCWGRGIFGQLGTGAATAPNLGAPSVVVGLPNAGRVASGGRHNCAQSGQEIHCWGYGRDGQLGNGSSAANSGTPVPVPGLPLAQSAEGIGSGEAHSCAIFASVYCWGRNDFGQLGNGSQVNSSTPQAVIGLPSVVEVVGGQSHTCAIAGAGQVYCWGSDAFGQLGNGSGGASLTPVAVALPAGQGALSLMAGAHHTCAVLAPVGTFAGGTVWCWGRRVHGQVGGAQSLPNQQSPAPVPGILDAAQVFGGGNHTCAIRNPLRDVVCWGSGHYMQLGQLSALNLGSPVLVPGITGGAFGSS